MKKVPVWLGTISLLAVGTSIALFERTPISQVAAEGCNKAVVSSVKHIDLNDNEEPEIRAYYSSLNALSEEERTGTNLLKNLRPILYNMDYYSYDDVWKIYEITDRDWEASKPEDDVYGEYDSATNCYLNYQYSSGISSTKNNPYVHALYRDPDNPNGKIRNWDDHAATGTNREHVWCQSRGFKAPSGAEGPAGTDVHHLICADGRVNQTHHNNNPYGYVRSIDQETAAYNQTYPFLAGNKRGAPATAYTVPAGETACDVVFEPQDCDKGDIARACFYMVARYNNLGGHDQISDYEPNLTLADYPTSNGAREASSATHAVAMGIMSDLLEWNRNDPVDAYEIHRNNLIYNNYQHNRNPFIDFPEWAEYIWGDKANIEAADPETDSLNCYKAEAKNVTGLTWTKAPDKTTYILGEPFSSKGAVITATFDDGSSENVVSSCRYEANFTEVGTAEVKANYRGFSVTTSVIIKGWYDHDNESIAITRSNFASSTTAYGTLDEWNCTDALGKNYTGKADLTTTKATMQMSSSSSVGVYNETEMPGDIVSITLTAASNQSTSRTMDIYGGTDVVYANGALDQSNRVGRATITSSSPFVLNFDTPYRYFAFASPSGAVYLDEVSITCDVREVNASSFSSVLLSKTSPICREDGQTDLAALSSAWSDLKQLYQQLPSLSQTFFAQDEDNDVILRARARYVLILSEHPSLESFAFKPSEGNNVLFQMKNSLPIVLIGILSASGITMALLLRKGRKAH